jgi:hypothetical protein
MKLKLKGCQFGTTEEIQAESQGVLDTLDRKGLLGSVPKMEEKVGLVLAYMTADRPYGEF